MSFAKPKPNIEKKSKTPMPKAARPHITSTTRHELSLHKPTESSLAKSTHCSGQNETSPRHAVRATRTKGCPQQIAPLGCKGSLNDVDSRQSHSCDEWYGNYLQSVLAACSTRRNAEVRARDVLKKDCTMLWAALSAQRTCETMLKTSHHEILLLKKYAAKKSSLKAYMERLTKVVLSIASVVKCLTKSLENTRNSIQIHGVELEDGDLIDISKAFRQSSRLIYDLSATYQNKTSFIMDEHLKKLQIDLEQAIYSYKECKALVKIIRSKSILVASSDFSIRGKYVNTTTLSMVYNGRLITAVWERVYFLKIF